MCEKWAGTEPSCVYRTDVLIYIHDLHHAGFIYWLIYFPPCICCESCNDSLRCYSLTKEELSSWISWLLQDQTMQWQICRVAILSCLPLVWKLLEIHFVTTAYWSTADLLRFRASFHHDGGLRCWRWGDVWSVQRSPGPRHWGPPWGIQTHRQTQDWPEPRQPPGTPCI